MESFVLITIMLFKPCSQVRCLTCFAMAARVLAGVKRKKSRKNRDSVLVVTLPDNLSNQLMEFFRRIYPLKQLDFKSWFPFFHFI